MRVQYCSDLHLEFAENSAWLADNPLPVLGDVLVLAGDIGILNCRSYLLHPFWDYLSENFARVIVVPGNHEFYGGYDVSRAIGHSEEIRTNISWHYNEVVEIEDIKFILSPLWSKIKTSSMQIIESRVSDFHLIKYRGKRLTAQAFNELHEGCVEFLRSALEAPTARKRVVVTHHLPSMLCMADEYKSSIISQAFVSSQDNLVERSNADLWIYGHSHRNIATLQIGATKMVCNQLGYVNKNEHHDFRNTVAEIF